MTDTTYKFTTLLILIGALNWGLVGAFDVDILTKMFGGDLFTKVVYVLIGVSALIHLMLDTKLIKK